MPDNHFITLADAISMTSRYRDEMGKILGTQYQSREILPLCETFDKEAFTTIMDDSQAVSVRIYMGMDEDLHIKAIIVGVDRDDKDILPPDMNEATGKLIEYGRRCPRVCPPRSVLNS